jgi:8-oxo-dGTP diphosphatase
VRVVVGVAIVEGGRVLAARRAAPHALAGRWELPGGKVERDEAPEAAAAREIAEELGGHADGCEIAVTGWLDGSSPIGEDLELRVAAARLVSGDPVPSEHDAVRWLRADQLDEVTWAESDVAFLDALRDLLGER